MHKHCLGGWCRGELHYAMTCYGLPCNDYGMPAFSPFLQGVATAPPDLPAGRPAAAQTFRARCWGAVVPDLLRGGRRLPRTPSTQGAAAPQTARESGGLSSPDLPGEPPASLGAKSAQNWFQKLSCSFLASTPKNAAEWFRSHFGSRQFWVDGLTSGGKGGLEQPLWPRRVC